MCNMVTLRTCRKDNTLEPGTIASTDGRTTRFQYTPTHPNFVAGGINIGTDQGSDFNQIVRLYIYKTHLNFPKQK